MSASIMTPKSHQKIHPQSDSISTMKTSRLVMIPIIFAVAFTGLWLSQIQAFESYHDPRQDDQGYCSDCHPGFTGGRSDTLHARHTGGADPVTTNCDLCHIGSNHDNPLTLWSSGDNNDGFGCMGCHGRDYGETIKANHRDFLIFGKAKASGYGLRLHHYNAGITICLSCHLLEEPFPENDPIPPYYNRDDVSLGGKPLHPCTNEDSANDADDKGLDNDGDFLYDTADPDCQLCIVDLGKMAAFAGHWLESSCGPGNNFCGGADLDKLGSVDLGDFGIIAGLWLKTCPLDWLLE